MCQSSQKLIGFRFALKANLQTIGVAAAAVAASIAGAQEAGNGDASAPKARTAPTTAQVSIPRDATERMKWDILPILKACQVEATSDKERIVIPWNGKNRAGLVRFVQVLNKREAYLILNMYCSAITTASSDKSQADAHYRREIRVANGRDADVEVYCDRSRVDLSRYSQRFQRPPGAGTGERLTLHGFMDRSPQRRAKVPERNPIRRPDNQDGVATFPNDGQRLGGAPTRYRPPPHWKFDSNIDLRRELDELNGVVIIRDCIETAMRFHDPAFAGPVPRVRIKYEDGLVEIVPHCSGPATLYNRSDGQADPASDGGRTNSGDTNQY